VALDGKDPSYIKFFEKNKIPLIYSECREGVGLSKNRVLAKFPNYEYYFFIDDDVELINADVFEIHIEISNNAKLHHLSLGEQKRFIDVTEIKKIHNFSLMYSMIGSGAFNFFTKKGIDQVGGWHTEFARHKRFGHTEHSYRYYNKGISKAPFITIMECINYLRWHNPISVTPVPNVEVSQKLLHDSEVNIMKKKLEYFPISTICQFHFNGLDMNLNYKASEIKIKGDMIDQFLTKREKKLIRSQEIFDKAVQYKNKSLRKILFLTCFSILISPLNNKTFFRLRFILSSLKIHIKSKVLNYR
jgi:hypothetical protein